MEYLGVVHMLPAVTAAIAVLHCNPIWIALLVEHGKRVWGFGPSKKVFASGILALCRLFICTSGCHAIVGMSPGVYYGFISLHRLNSDWIHMPMILGRNLNGSVDAW